MWPWVPPITGSSGFRSNTATDRTSPPHGNHRLRCPTAAEPRHEIAVCDWTILKRQKPGAFQLTKNIGADGVEVDRICQIHCTNEDGVWLKDDPKIDMKKVKNALDQMGWRGWLVIERSRNAKDPPNVKWNFEANTRYLKSVFQK